MLSVNEQKMSMARSESFPVEVVYAPRLDVQTLVALEVTCGTTLGEALELSGLVDDPDACDTGVFGHKRPLSYRLRPNDRIEIYRSLLVDPKEARRRRIAHKRRRT